MQQQRGEHRAGFADAVEPAVDAAASYAERKRAEGIAGMTSVVAAVHRAADEIESQLPTAAEYTHQAAERLEKASDALRSQPLENVARSIGEFARTRPVAFLGGAVLAGFALSRFLKSSARAGDSGIADRARASDPSRR